MNRSSLFLLLGCGVVLAVVFVWQFAAPDSGPAGREPAASSVEDIFVATDRWIDRLPVDPAGLEKETFELGRRLFSERRIALASLIESDPEQALERALSDRERSALPKELLPLIEEPVRASGDFMVAIACSGYHEPGAHPESEYWREALIPGEKGSIKVHTYGPRQEVHSLENAPLDGIRIEDVAALYGAPLRLLRPGDEGFVAGEIHARFGGRILTFSTPQAFEEAQNLAIVAERNAAGPVVSYPDSLLSQAGAVMDSSLVTGGSTSHNYPSPRSHE